MDGWTIGHVVSIVALLVASGCPAADDGETIAGSGDSSGDVDGSGTTSTASSDPTSTDSGSDACTELACAADRYCEFQFNSCGTRQDDPPSCGALPDLCDGDDPPVCGCDGVVYPDECSAAAAGADLSVTGGCVPPPDLFVCGPKFCDATESYCTITDGLAGLSYECIALPETCGDAPSCACLMDVEFCGDCEATPDGGLSLSCAGA